MRRLGTNSNLLRNAGWHLHKKNSGKEKYLVQRNLNRLIAQACLFVRMMRHHNISSNEQRKTHTLFNVIGVFLFSGLHCFLKVSGTLTIPLHSGATSSRTSGSYVYVRIRIAPVGPSRAVAVLMGPTRIFSRGTNQEIQWLPTTISIKCGQPKCACHASRKKKPNSCPALEGQVL